MWPEKGWIRPVGPTESPKIAIVGEAPGEEEARMGMPFVGPSGKLLDSMLRRAGIDRDECYLTNVFLERPPLNNLEAWAVTKTEANNGWKELGRPGKYPFPTFYKTKYLDPKRTHVVGRLELELQKVKPNMVLALGNTACWALLGTSGIMKLRGTVAQSTLIKGLKVLPTYHPSAVLRQWENYVVTLADIAKAARLQHTPLIEVPKREIWINPTIADMEEYFEKYLKNATHIAVDVETAGKQINCIGFAPSIHTCLVIPIWDSISKEKKGNLWTHEEEVQVVDFIRRVMALPAKKVFQNGSYDIQYIWKTLGIPMKGEMEDTMLLHHALQPEMKKGLGFLGSIYCDSPAWKSMRLKAMDTEKRDE